MSTTSNDTASDNGTVKKVNRRTFTERLADLTFEQKVETVKALKEQIAEEQARRTAAAVAAQELTKGL